MGAGEEEFLAKALLRVGTKILAASRLRTILFVFFTAAGVGALYLGLPSRGLAPLVGAGILLLCGLAMRFHVRPTALMIAELRRELDRLRTEHQADSP